MLTLPVIGEITDYAIRLWALEPYAVIGTVAVSFVIVLTWLGWDRNVSGVSPGGWSDHGGDCD